MSSKGTTAHRKAGIAAEELHPLILDRLGLTTEPTNRSTDRWFYDFRITKSVNPAIPTGTAEGKHWDNQRFNNIRDGFIPARGGTILYACLAPQQLQYKPDLQLLTAIRATCTLAKHPIPCYNLDCYYGWITGLEGAYDDGIQWQERHDRRPNGTIHHYFKRPISSSRILAQFPEHNHPYEIPHNPKPIVSTRQQSLLT